VALDVYRKKRKFGVTPEPRGRKEKRSGSRYVIQKHAARQLHYDLRLELDGVVKSWAVCVGRASIPARSVSPSMSRTIRSNTTLSRAPSRKANMAAAP